MRSLTDTDSLSARNVRYLSGMPETRLSKSHATVHCAAALVEGPTPILRWKVRRSDRFLGSKVCYRCRFIAFAESAAVLDRHWLHGCTTTLMNVRTGGERDQGPKTGFIPKFPLSNFIQDFRLQGVKLTMDFGLKEIAVQMKWKNILYISLPSFSKKASLVQLFTLDLYTEYWN